MSLNEKKNEHTALERNKMGRGIEENSTEYLLHSCGHQEKNVLCFSENNVKMCFVSMLQLLGNNFKFLTPHM